MIDYVIKIADLPPFKAALKTAAEAGNHYARIKPPLTEAELALPVTGIIAKIGNATVSICRLTGIQYDWLVGLPAVVELGSGDPFIKEISDITWIGAGKGLYHAIHLQDFREVDDGEGGTITMTPPLLHCILAS